MTDLDRLLGASLRYVRNKAEAAEDRGRLTSTRREVVTRVKRRRVRNAALAAAAVIATLLGGVVGARVLLVPDRAPEVPAERPWAGLWPHETRAEAHAAQERVDAGDPQYRWLVEAEAFLERFGSDSLGWREVFFDDSLDVSEPDAAGLTVRIANCDLNDGGAGCGEDAEHTVVTVERLVRRDESGVWSVTDFFEPVGIDSTRLVYGRVPLGSFECPAGPFASATAQEVINAGHRLLAASNRSRARDKPELVWTLLDPSVQAGFGSFDLFAYLFRATPVERAYRKWDVGAAEPAGAYVNDFVTTVTAACEDAAAASWRTTVFFPRFEGLSGSGVDLFFLVRPGGPKLWFAI